jgi:glutamate racemase
VKVGIFDSGIGGITVLSSLQARFPNVEYIYLGDTANLPYGTKSPSQVVKLSLACAETLRMKGVDAVVVACNTASSLALHELRQALGPIRVYGVVEPGVQAVLDCVAQEPAGFTSLPILVLATRATVRSEAYGRALRAALDIGRHPIFEQPCPLLVPMIEEGWTEHPILKATVDEYVSRFRDAHPRGIALLGCTHYPWVQASVERALPGWTVVNSAQAISRALEEQLKPVQNNQNQIMPGKLEWIFTDPDALPAFARQLIGKEVSRG